MTGAGVALDAAARGYRVALCEQSDFAKGTSSRSTKLIHGGVRYLQQGNVSLVTEALRERHLLRQNAPHLVNALEFIVPSFRWYDSTFYGMGLKVYDLLAGKRGLGRSKHLSRAGTIQRLPTIRQQGLRGGTLYVDANGDGIVDGGEVLGATDTVAVADILANRLKFKPAADANGVGYDSFDFQVQDDGAVVS